MDLILCHTTADFDTLGAAVGLSRLYPGARIVLTGGSHPTVRDFLALHRDEYPLIERRSVNAAQIHSIAVVDTQWRDRLGKAAEWLDLPQVEVSVYDHHCDTSGDILAHHTYLEPIGATATLIAEQLQQHQISLNAMDATVMALGIHVDTGSLTFDHTTVRDAAALTWLMQQGASVRAIAEYAEPGLSPPLQDLLTVALEQLQTETVHGLAIAWVLLQVDAYIPGLSHLAAQLMDVTECDALILAARHPSKDSTDERLSLIGRLQGWMTGGRDRLNLGALFAQVGGGGHAKAAAATLRTADPVAVVQSLVQQLRAQIPRPPTAQELMSSPVRTIRPDTSIAEAQRILLRYGHSGLSVVDAQDQLVGIISRRDIDIALHHGFSHAPVKGYMTPNLKTITPDTPLPDIEALMVNYDIGRLPVLDRGELVGIVTRTDVLRQLHQEKTIGSPPPSDTRASLCPLPQRVRDWLRDRLTPALWSVLMATAEEADRRGWQLYAVGGAVRDLLLAAGNDSLRLDDIDLVVDGVRHAPGEGAGVALARSLQAQYPQSRLQVHGRFQTAALLWHNDPDLDSLWIDIATARTEFYPYPAANPEVEASSIRQDLYRRDFTINALAVRLTPPRVGELLDFFGGLEDLQAQQIRVLHANSFIEDPTRIYRAVRFAVRLGFQLEPQTEGYIRHAIASGIYHRIQTEMEKTPALQTRLKRELKYILQAPYWERAIHLLDDLGALCCLHPSLHLTPTLWKRMRLMDRGLRRFDTDCRLEHWQLLLEVLLLDLAEGDRLRVAQHLQLPAASLERLQRFDHTLDTLSQVLSQVNRPSQIVHHLSPYDPPLLVLLAVYLPRPTRACVWEYLTHLVQVKPLLTGHDLKTLGYRQGRQFKEILEAVLAATLDGVVSDRSQAIAFVTEHFPLTHPE